MISAEVFSAVISIRLASTLRVLGPAQVDTVCVPLALKQIAEQ